MSTVQNTASPAIASTALFGAGGGAGGSTSDTQATQDRFLSLLVAQMKNQDPLNPLDNAQVTSQMAQLSTVTGIEKMNSSLGALAASLGSAQTAQAANLIGHVVLAPGDFVSPTEGQNVVGFDLPYGVDKLTVTVRDASGAPVRTLDMGARPGGTGLASWDGLNDAGAAVAAGAYRFTLDAVQGGRAVEATSLALGAVSSVYQDASGVQLDLGAAGNTSYSGVRRIY